MINNPVTGTLTSSAIAGSIVAILAWFVSLPQFGSVIVPSQVQLAATVVIGWLLSILIHDRNGDGIPDALGSESKGFTTLSALIFLVLVGVSMVLAACGSAPKPNGKTPNQIAADAFTAACIGVPVADLAFSAVGIFNPKIIDANARKWESPIIAGLQKRCAGPTPTVETYPQVVAEIAADIKQIMDVVAAAKNNPPAP